MPVLFLALLACKDDSPSDDSGPQCGSTDGFVYGTVYDVGGSTPFSGGATVQAYDDNGSAPVEAVVQSDGSYEVNLLGGQPWTLTATYSMSEDSGGTDCWAEDILMEIEACREYQQDIVFDECASVDKPNLYLYPAADQPTAVRLEMQPRQRVIASAPPYRGAWRGVAHPDGTFTVGDKRAPFLFYEVSLLPAQSAGFQREQGWCLPEVGAVEAMAELLAAYGFNAQEREDFIEAWEHDLPPAQGYAVYPQTEVDFVATLDVQPAMPIERLWLLVEDGAGCDALPEPAVMPFDRRGAHGVEWGVIVKGLGRW